MRKIAIMGDIDSIYAFSAIGIEPFEVYEREEALEQLKKLILGEYAVIYLTEKLFELLQNDISQYYESSSPILLPIPGVGKQLNTGINNLKTFVEKAVGSDILSEESKNNG